jgi:DNA end-binding protein Ku
MRPIWNGHISFGLISIPVSLSSAIEASERVSFHLLHRKDRAPIRYKKFCSREDVEVPSDEIVRGFEVAKGKYTLVEKGEIAAAEAEATGDEEGTMQVLQFIPAGSLNPLSFDHPYYVRPRKGGERAYGVLRAALADTRRIGISRLPLRGRPTLGALIPGPDAIALESLRPFEELRDPGEVLSRKAQGSAGEVRMAKLLIDQLSAEGWDPSEYPDAYRKALEKLLSSKSRFELKTPSAAASPDNGKVVDLMTALKKSLDQAKARPKRRGAA